MKPVPKKIYKALPPKTKAKVKAAVAVGKGAYKLKGKGAYNFVRGKGDFFSGLVSGLANTADQVLGGVPRAMANRAGQFLGHGSYRNFVRGKGDYVGAPAATLSPPAVPLMSKKSRANTFTYREYLGDVYSSVDFATTVFNINPGLGDPGNTIAGSLGLFPWLAPIAANYEQYTVDQGIIEYISTSSDAVVSGATTSSLGQVCIATQYNAEKPAYSNLTDALNSQYATTEKPSINFCHVIECVQKEKTQNVQFVRQQPLASGQDILQYDMGQVSLITQGMPAAGEVIGQLWISYKVSLYKPILTSEVSPNNIQFAHYAYANSGSDVAAAAWWGTTGGMKPTSATNMDVTFGSTSNVTMPQNSVGNVYKVDVAVFGGSTTLTTAPTISYGAGCVSYPLFYNDSSNAFTLVAASTSTRAFISFYMQVISTTAATWAIASATVPSSPVWVDCVITQVNIAANKLAISPAIPGNFWRGSKTMPTAPWMRGKKTGDRVHDKKDTADRYAMLDTLIQLLADRRIQQSKVHDEPVESKESDYELVKVPRTPLRKNL